MFPTDPLKLSLQSAQNEEHSRADHLVIAQLFSIPDLFRTRLLREHSTSSIGQPKSAIDQPTGPKIQTGEDYLPRVYVEEHPGDPAL